MGTFSNMNKKLFSGIMPALPTPFNVDGSLKAQTARDLTEWLIGKGASGFYVCGATGEGTVLPVKTRMEMLETVIGQANGRVKVIAHIMATDIHDTMVLAEHAQSAGADCVASLIPDFFTRYSDDELSEYYTKIAASVDIPVMMYATPIYGDGDITDLVRRLIDIPNLCGVKFTRNNYYEMHKLTEINGGNITVINGPDEMLLCGLCMGADGGIGSTYNVMCDSYVSLYNSYRSGEIQAARKMQFKINRIIEVLFKYGNLGSIKFLLSHLGFDMGNVAFPGKILSTEEQKNLLKDLKNQEYLV
jgi:N-acetylneuraminate lyase